jgi:hypothetical protein
MSNLLSEFWGRLDGAVHPDDVSVFDRYRGNHGFNLDYPLPAFWGDVEQARILILDNNGGYKARVTQEFPDEAARRRHLDRLGRPRPLCLAEAPPYYQTLNFAEWLANGCAALVNAVAYRSIDSNALNVRTIARELPSVKLHQRWLWEVAVPAAREGERFLIFHRWSLWNIGKETPQLQSPNIIFSSASINPNLTATEIEAVQRWKSRFRVGDTLRENRP